jgi:hypothetical protein
LSAWSVSGAGDVNADGLADLLVGAIGVETNGSNSGASYIVFGQSSGRSIELSALAAGGFVVNGESEGDACGDSVSGAGDVNGDGLADVLVGASQAGSDSGATYLVFGADFSAAVTAQGGPDDDTLFATGGRGGQDVLVGDQGDDTLVGDGGPDVIFGGQGNDRITIGDTSVLTVSGGGGNDTLALATPGMSLDFTMLRRRRFSNIETIDLTGQGDNALAVSMAEVGALSSLASLTVLGDAGDSVFLVAAGVTTGSEPGFQLYSKGPVVLRVADGVDVVVGVNLR